MHEILVVEDDIALSHGIAMALRSEQIHIAQCHTLLAAKNHLAVNPVGLAILDINLPDGSGIDLLRELRGRQGISVILLTANDTETDIVTGLDSGADDYITKPFSLAVLRARVNAQLRKLESSTSSLFLLDSYRFDFDTMQFSKNAAPIELSKTEQKLLRLLVENKGITLERSKLIDRIWTDGAEYVDENALSVTIKRLRDKLEDNPSHPEYIKTVYGIGYTWAVK
ncbi:response regulator transcription factor [Butyricicoccus sp. Marseille-Q5471]|uniref:response regulator transcription factor n=1 Tax=Butyricicoccus sp. Marseille-Q5471 TaxID=3039493 RepID=UPI0024BC1802|nr:response regulator transcription factor [Butyricicoccus sp. Marseille-Q5471]